MSYKLKLFLMKKPIHLLIAAMRCEVLFICARLKVMREPPVE